MPEDHLYYLSLRAHTRCTRKQGTSFAFFQKHTTALTYINDTAVTPLILGHSQMTAPVPTGAIPRMGQPGDLLMS